MIDYRTRLCDISADLLRLVSELDRDLVRCKDCKWQTQTIDGAVCSHTLNTGGGSFSAVQADDEHFCGRAERKVKDG